VTGAYVPVMEMKVSAAGLLSSLQRAHVLVGESAVAAVHVPAMELLCTAALRPQYGCVADQIYSLQIVLQCKPDRTFLPCPDRSSAASPFIC